MSLAEDGKKYEAVRLQVERLRTLAAQNGMSMDAFLDDMEQTRTEKRKQELVEACGGNEAMAEHILALERTSANPPESEWHTFFPDKEESEIPESVRLSAHENHRPLVDEYLRYLAQTRLKEQRSAVKQRQNRLSSPGSLRGSGTEETPDEHTAFLKGLWG